MKKLPKPIQYMILLFCLGLITGGLLALINSITAPRIEAYENEKTNEALKELVDFSVQEEITEKYNQDTKNIGNIYLLKDDSNKKIAVVYRVTTKGYGGNVVTLVAINLENDTFINSKIISADSETPGIGSKILDHDFGISGSSVSSSELNIISGATFSSNAVKNAIEIASNNYKQNSSAIKGGE